MDGGRTDRSREMPLVSIVMPIRNEADHIDRALDAVEAQSYSGERIEILVVDGGSTDGTLERVEARRARGHRIRILGGEGVNTPAAMNVGIEASIGEYVAKVDGHGWINPSFIGLAVDHLTRDARLGCVGGRVVPEATTAVQRAIGFARFSRLGVGTGVYTMPDRAQLADTVQCGVYRRTAIVGVGGFDEAMQFGEDEEVNHRLRTAGWSILMDPAMRFSYRVRPSIRALFTQYLRYGRARVRVVRKHREFFRPKHAAPAALIVTLVVSLMLGPLVGRAFALPWIAYGGLLAGGAVGLTIRHRFGRPDLIAASLAALHIGYGLGTIRGLIDPPALRYSRAAHDR